MNKKWFAISFAIVCVSILASCGSKKTGTESLVPSDAKVVIAINAQQLMDKLAKGGINIDNPDALPKLLTDSITKPFANFWTDGAKTGIDFSQPIVIAMTPIENGNEFSNKPGAFRVVAGIKNKDSFVAFIKKNQEEVTVETGSTTYIFDEDDMALAVNSKYAVALDPDNFRNYSKEGDRTLVTKDAIKKALKNALDGDSKSILSNKDYTKIPTAQNDIKMWSDLAFIGENNKNMDMAARSAYNLMKDALKGSNSTTVFNFENGKVTTKSLVKMNDDIAKIIQKTPAQTIDISMLTNYPGNTLNGIVAFSINPNLVNDFAKFMKQDGLMAIALGKMNLQSADVFDAFTGDGMYILNDMNADALQNKQEPNWGILLKVKDKAKVEKLMAFPEFAKMLKQEGGMYTIQQNEFDKPSYMAFANNTMVVSSTKATVESYVAGTTKNTFDVTKLDVLKGKSFGYYLDVASVSTVIKGLTNTFLAGEEKGTIVNSIMAMFSNTYMTSGNFKDGYAESNGVLNLTNKDMNSLAYMIKTGFRSYLMYENTSRDEDWSGMPNKSGTDKIDLSDIDAETGDRVQPMKVK